MTGGEETSVTTYNHDPAAELAQAEAICREWLPFTREGEAICWVMVEYDRRGAELEQLRRERAAILALADGWLMDLSQEEDDDHGKLVAAVTKDHVFEVRHALGVEA